MVTLQGQPNKEQMANGWVKQKSGHGRYLYNKYNFIVITYVYYNYVFLCREFLNQKQVFFKICVREKLCEYLIENLLRNLQVLNLNKH